MSNLTAKEDLSLPRILCLHGGGVNAEVFRMQARSIIRALGHRFRFVFADAPFFCEPGPGIVPVYQDFGPFRRWLRWLPDHAETESEAAQDEIWWQLKDAIDTDTLNGATGEFVGLLGFSQGAKLSASLLFEQQYRNKIKQEGKSSKEDDERPNFKFAVLLAGRAPLVSLRRETDDIKALVSAADISEGFDTVAVDTDEHILRLPTIHVHGLQDAGLHLHQRLLKQYCDASATILVEWDGAHRVPFKTADVQKIAEAMVKVADEVGV